MLLPYSTYIMTSSNGNIFRVTGPLWVEFTGHRWIHLTKASDVELWCFLWSGLVQTVEHTIEMQVIRDAIALIMTSLLWGRLILCWDMSWDINSALGLYHLVILPLPGVKHESNLTIVHHVLHRFAWHKLCDQKHVNNFKVINALVDCPTSVGARDL